MYHYSNVLHLLFHSNQTDIILHFNLFLLNIIILKIHDYNMTDHWTK